MWLYTLVCFHLKVRELETHDCYVCLMHVTAEAWGVALKQFLQLEYQYCCMNGASDCLQDQQGAALMLVISSLELARYLSMYLLSWPCVYQCGVWIWSTARLVCISG